jgi:hypothetical protein
MKQLLFRATERSRPRLDTANVKRYQSASYGRTAKAFRFAGHAAEALTFSTRVD